MVATWSDEDESQSKEDKEVVNLCLITLDDPMDVEKYLKSRYNVEEVNNITLIDIDSIAITSNYGQSIIEPHSFNGENFIRWINEMKVFIQRKN